MKEHRTIMGMPVTVEIVDPGHEHLLPQVFDYLQTIDDRFSTYKSDSEISRINRGELRLDDASEEMRKIFRLADETKQATQGFFDIRKADGTIDPSGLVKGWAIFQAGQLLDQNGVKNFYVDVGGDIEARGHNTEGQPWRVGIRNPFNKDEIIKVLRIENAGVATSGTYERGAHIYNPHNHDVISDIVSMTVIGPNIYEADRFATAAFAMGQDGINFIEALPNFEGFMIDQAGIGTETNGFHKFIAK